MQLLKLFILILDISQQIVDKSNINFDIINIEDQYISQNIDLKQTQTQQLQAKISSVRQSSIFSKTAYVEKQNFEAINLTLTNQSNQKQDHKQDRIINLNSQEQQKSENILSTQDSLVIAQKSLKYQPNIHEIINASERESEISTNTQPSQVLKVQSQQPNKHKFTLSLNHSQSQAQAFINHQRQQSRDKFFEELYKRGDKSSRSRDLQKLKTDIELKNCTFKPQITPFLKSMRSNKDLRNSNQSINLSRGSHSFLELSINQSMLQIHQQNQEKLSDLEVHDRLFKEHQAKERQLQIMKERSDMKTMRECTFQPNLKDISRNIHQRRRGDCDSIDRGDEGVLGLNSRSKSPICSNQNKRQIENRQNFNQNRSPIIQKTYQQVLKK